MSEIKKYTLVCPECGKEFEATAYDSINVTIDPDLKEKVMDGSIFDFECPECHKTFKKEFSFLYHDMNRKRMIFFGDTVNLLLSYAEIKKAENNRNIPGLKGFMNEIEMSGVRRWSDLVNEITAADEGLDRKKVTLTCAMTICKFDKFCGGYMYTESCILTKKDDGELYMVVKQVSHEDHEATYTEIPFDMEECESRYEGRKDIIDMLSSDFIFDTETAEKIIFGSLNTEKCRKEKEETVYFCVTEDMRGNKDISLIPVFNAGKFTRGDNVVIMKDMKISSRRINAVFESTVFDCPFWIDGAPTVAWKKVMSVTPVNPVENIGRQLKSFTNDEVILRGAAVWVKPDKLLSRLARNTVPEIRITDGSFCCRAYIKECEDTEGCILCSFDNLAGFILSNYNKYDGGIILKDGDKEFRLSIRALREYKTNRIMLDHEAMRGLLEKLTDEEKKYMGISYDAIYKVYTEDTNPKKVAEELNISDDEIDYALSHGYRLLKHIILDNYFSDSVS